MNKIGNQFSTIEQATEKYLSQKNRQISPVETEVSFQDIFLQTRKQTESKTLKFSKHASMRLQDRNIGLSQEQRQRLETGTQKAQEKGIKETLVLIDTLAFIVNVPNKTVVTAMEQSDVTENVYTNIDGAVII